MPRPAPPSLAQLASAWRERAEELRSLAAEGQARAFERAAQDLADALAREREAVLTLEQAAQESGYSADHLRHLVAEGTVPNAGRHGAPRVRRGDLPTRPGKVRSSPYDPDTDALQLLRGAS